ncbi:glycosyltransferase family 39 protein [Streptomyces sp. S6]
MPLRRVWVPPVLWTVVLGVWGLSRENSVWRDEAATWQVAERPVGEIWAMLGNVDVVHGVYYLFMHVVFEWFGASTTSLRLPSVVGIAVAAGCVAVVGERLADRWVGLAAGMTVGLLPAVQFQLQEGRSYALVAGGAGVATLLVVEELSGRARKVAYGSVVLVIGLLNWLSLMLLVAHLVTLLWSGAGRKVLVGWAVAAGAATAGVLPLVLFSRGQSEQVAWIPPLTWHMLIGPAVLMAIGCAGALVDRPKAGQLSVAVVGLPLLMVPQLGLIGLSLVQPLYMERYVLYSMLGLALLIGSSLGAAIRTFSKARGWVLAGVLAVATVALLPQSLAKRSPESRVDDVLAVASAVERLKGPGDAVAFLPGDRRDARWVSPEKFEGLRDVTLVATPRESENLKGVEADAERIRAALLGERRVLLVSDAGKGARPARGARDLAKKGVLERYFRVVADERMRGRRVTVYERLSVPGGPSGR